MKSIALLLCVLMVSFVSPAWAQGKRHSGDSAAAKPEDTRKKKADEDAYQRALKSIPEPKGKSDPWSGAR